MGSVQKGISKIGHFAGAVGKTVLFGTVNAVKRNTNIFNSAKDRSEEGVPAPVDIVTASEFDGGSSDGVSEGNPIPFVVGQAKRVVGQIIFKSPVREVGTDQFLDLAIAWARPEELTALPLLKIWVFGNVVYDEASGDIGERIVGSGPEDPIVSTDIEVTLVNNNMTAHPESKSSGSGGVPVDRETESMVTFLNTGTTAGEENFFSQFRLGYLIRVNDEFFWPIAIYPDLNGVLDQSSLVAIACDDSWDSAAPNAGADALAPPVLPSTEWTLNLEACAGNTPNVETAGASKRFYQQRETTSTIDLTSITHYNGSETQLVDPVLEGILGTGLVQAFRGTAYTVIEGLNVTEFGGSVGRIEALFSDSPTRTVGEAIALLAARVGIDPNDIDVSGVTGDLSGYSSSGVVSPKADIQALMGVHGVEYQSRSIVDTDTGEFRQKFFWFDRNQGDGIPISNLGAFTDGEDSLGRLAVSDRGKVFAPRSLTLRYEDVEKDYQPGSRTYVAAQAGQGSDDNVAVSHALTPTEGETIVTQEYWRQFLTGQDAIAFSVPFIERRHQEGDVVQVVDDSGRTRVVRITKKDFGANGLIEFEASPERDAIFNLVSFGSVGGGTVGALDESPPLNEFVCDLPTLYFQDGAVQQLTVAAGPTDPIHGRWLGATLYESLDGLSWTAIDNLTTPAVTGRIGGTTRLADETAHPAFVDTFSTFIIVLDDDSVVLESAPMNEVASGMKNIGMLGSGPLGGEIFGYMTATKTGPRTWELSNLLRGRRGTQDWITKHAVGERFLLLSGPGIVRYNISSVALGVDRRYRVVPRGGDPMGFDEQVSEAGVAVFPYDQNYRGRTFRFPPQARSSRPFRPQIVQALRLGETPNIGDVEFIMRRRVQTPFRLFGGVIAPETETDKDFRLKFVNESTFDVLTTETGAVPLYTAADQTTDYASSTKSSFVVVATNADDDLVEGLTERITVEVHG